MRRIFVAAIAVMLLGAQHPAALSQESTPIPDEYVALLEQLQRGEVCAWPAEVAVDSLNVSLPEANAVYYLMPYMLQPGRSLVVEGVYPFARFFSLTTYFGTSAGGQGLEPLAWLRDTEIAPNPGSSNPALDPNAPPEPAQRRWSVRVTGTPPVGDAARVGGTPTTAKNVIPAHPEGVSGQRGWLVMRVYVPDDPADRSGGVGLPALFMEEADGSRRPLPECATEEEQAWTGVIRASVASVVAAAPRLPLPPSPDAQPAWTASRVPGLAPNPDNRYLLAPVAWEPGRIVVIRGQAPTFADTRAGESATTPTDLRYWSFCTGSNVIDPPMAYPTTDCVGDFEIPLGADGSYTIVISQPDDQPATATAENGVAWLQGADPALPDLIAMRHMLPSEEFASQSIWAVPEGEVGAAQAIMGPYYPQAVYCDTATFEAGGADACFAAGELATPAV